MDEHRRHRPLHGGAVHVTPDEPRLLEEWDGFAYRMVGTAPDLRVAQTWATESVGRYLSDG